MGYLRIKGARSLEPGSLAVLRELYLMRDARAREIDRPPFKVLGNRTLLEMSQSHATDLDSLANIKGITDLILKRLGKDLVAAVKKGLRKPHGPIPKIETTARRRMDRRSEKRLAALKEWRGPRSEALKIDPGVLCPNAALESIAAADPENAEDMKAIPELKSWFVREFASEIIGVLERQSAEGEASAANPPPSEQRTATKRSGKKTSRGRRNDSATKAPSK
jgi:ribonuclease D